MTISFQFEPARRVMADPDFTPLMLDHWEELGVHKDQMPLDPDWDEYMAADDKGYFRIWTARDGTMLVGYLGFWIRPHAHYRSTLTAVEDLYMLSPAYRKGMTGYRMFSTAIEALRERGVKRAFFHDKVHFETQRGGVGKLLRRMGFIHTDNLYSMML